MFATCVNYAEALQQVNADIKFYFVKSCKPFGGVQESGQQQPWAACYICQLSSVPGKFLPQKAKALGVTPGPLFGQLKAGNAVQGKDRMIEPHEVHSLPRMPPCF